MYKCRHRILQARGKGGGIAAFMIEGAPVEKHTLLKQVENMVISLRDTTDKHLICILYRPPSLLFGKILQELENLIFDLKPPRKTSSSAGT